jgi:hypothetical protein
MKFYEIVDQAVKFLRRRERVSYRALRSDEPCSITTTPSPGSRNRLAEAHQMLLEIYGWFTEGFDTKDLQETKAVLEAL